MSPKGLLYFDCHIPVKVPLICIVNIFFFLFRRRRSQDFEEIKGGKEIKPERTEGLR